MGATTELGAHLPFGVGYFAPLRDWVSGTLSLSNEFSERDPRDQAQLLMVTALTSAARIRNLDRFLARLKAAGSRE